MKTFENIWCLNFLFSYYNITDTDSPFSWCKFEYENLCVFSCFIQKYPDPKIFMKVMLAENYILYRDKTTYLMYEAIKRHIKYTEFLQVEILIYKMLFIYSLVYMHD